jgi:hypothetical protein
MKTKKCSTCKEEKLLDDFCTNNVAKDKKNYHCRECMSKDGKKYRSTEKGKKVSSKIWKNWIRKPENKYRHYKNTNKSGKKLEFNILEKEFVKILNMPCHYCGEKTENIGIDRKDNKKGYISGNCLPCCWKCNYLKRGWDYNEFMDRIKKIYKSNRCI